MRSRHTQFINQLFALWAFLCLTSFSVGSKTTSPISLVKPNAIAEGEESLIALRQRGLSSVAIEQAMAGYEGLKSSEKLSKDILIVIDYTRSSNLERFYVVNMKDTSLTRSLLVAHGRNTGNEFAHSFSNEVGSYKSSLGFFKTAETYIGKHGLSLRMDGLEKGINDKARERAIVIHQADYVSLDFAKEHGRIGRSLGCPALPKEDYESVISLIKEGCLLYIFGGDEHYLQASALLSQS